MTHQATFCATLVDEWIRAGVTDAVIAPGSRSTPLAVALAGAGDHLRVHVHHDERAASFLALGLGLATGRPAIVLTTSGTAAVELHPAIVEADLASVPLIACTADRPPELFDIGAPQTIDQTHLFGRSTRWFAEPGVPDAGTQGSWRSLAARAVAEATGVRPGPVHLNLAFRDPLVGEAGPLPAGRGAGGTGTGIGGNEPWHRAGGVRADLADRELLDLVGLLAGKRGVIVAGAGAGDPAHVHALGRVAGWPVLADPRSGCRLPRPTTIAHADSLLRHQPFVEGHWPEVILQLGAPHSSKVLGQWLMKADVPWITVAAVGTWPDPHRTAHVVFHADPSAVCRRLTTALGEHGTEPSWLAGWTAANAAAADAIAGALSGRTELTEPGIAREVVAALPEGAALVAASSMPVRDVEWFAPPHPNVRMFANRGANGIDGVVSTAVGVALSQRAEAPTVALVGDVAFLHDTNALLGLRHRDLDLVVVVVDNDGGGIFSFLPQARTLSAEQFELLFGTPHGVRAEDLAAAHGVGAVTVEDASGLGPALKSAIEGGGVSVVVARTDRATNVKVHEELNAAVGRALAGLARAAGGRPAPS